MSRTYGELVSSIIDIVKDTVEPDVRDILLTLKGLPEPEDRVELSIRNLVIDVAIKRYTDIKQQEFSAKPNTK